MVVTVVVGECVNVISHSWRGTNQGHDRCQVYSLVWLILWIVVFKLLLSDRLHQFVELRNLLVLEVV